MPEIIFKADQGAGVRKIIRIMQGDTRSHVIRFVVPRYESGVDLAPLVWYIRFVDAAGKADIALPSELYEVTAEDLRIRWTVRGISTNIVGCTQFQLYGAGRDAEGNPVSWKSGVGEIEVTENMGFDITEDQEQELSQLDELILYSKQELNSLSNKANAIVATAEGLSVDIYPDEGSILKPVVTFGPVITGNAAPTPTAPCTLAARSTIVITNNGAAHDGRFDEPAYGGTVDWDARTVTIDTVMLTVTEDMVGGNSTASGGTADVVVWLVGDYQSKMSAGDFQRGWCSHFVNNRSAKDINTIRFGATTGPRTIYFYLSTEDFADAAAFKAFVAAQNAAGTPVQIVYPLASPVTVPLYAKNIAAYAGLNTLSVEAEAMTVAYNKSIVTALEESGGSGGGGSAGGGVFVVNLGWDDNDVAVADKTLDEIMTAFENGMILIAVDAEGSVYQPVNVPNVYAGAVFVSTEMLPSRSEVNVYYARIYPSGYVRTAGLILSGELDWDDGTEPTVN